MELSRGLLSHCSSLSLLGCVRAREREEREEREKREGDSLSCSQSHPPPPPAVRPGGETVSRPELILGRLNEKLIEKFVETFQLSSRIRDAPTSLRAVPTCT